MSKEELKVRFDEYMKLYGSRYSKKARDLIVKSFNEETYNTDYNADVVSQVYSYIGAYDDSLNVYKRFLDYITKYYDINGRLLEVASGMFPEMARIVSSRQTSGSVTCMDPSTIIYSLDRLKIKSKRISEHQNLSKFDLIYGLFPCRAILPTIIAANKCDKDLVLALCGCTHFEDSEVYRFAGMPEAYIRAEWMKKVITTMQDTIPDSREFTIDNDPCVPYPIIRTMKK